MHQGSALSPLLFVIVIEAINREFCTGLPWELLYADDLVVIAESERELVSKLKQWKDSLEQKGMKVNINKTKVLVSGEAKAEPESRGNGPVVSVEKGWAGTLYSVPSA